jgi:RNA polymerase sigma-70 factor (family 1)
VKANSTDEELFVKISTESDHSAFKELFDKYWQSLYALATRKTGEEHSAMDIVQDLFVDLWNRREAIEIKSSFKGYILSTLQYKVFSYYKTKGISKKLIKDFQEFSQAYAKTDHFDFTEIKDMEIRDEAMHLLIEETIEAMPGKMREIFKLSRSGNYSVSQLAERLNLSQQTIKNQVSNALSRLKEATKYTVASVIIFFLLK